MLALRRGEAKRDRSLAALAAADLLKGLAAIAAVDHLPLDELSSKKRNPIRTSAHNTAFHDRRGRILPQGVAAAQARWRRQPDPLNVNQGRTDYRQKSFGTSREHQQHNSIFDASKEHFHTIRGKRVYVIHGAALTAHMDEHNRKEGPPNLVSFTYDTDYKLAYRGAFFYPFIFHIRIAATPVDEWIIQFARALVAFPDIDERLFIFKDSDKADLNKGRTAEKFVETLGMSEPTAIAAACAITCASRELSRILRHDAPRQDDNSVRVHEVVDRFHYGPVMAALAVKTSGTSRFRAYLRYKGESQGQWCRSFDLGQDARDIVELKLMAVGGWSDKLEANRHNSVSSTQSPNKEPKGHQVTELSVVSWSPKPTETLGLSRALPGKENLPAPRNTIHQMESSWCTQRT